MKLNKTVIIYHKNLQVPTIKLLKVIKEISPEIMIKISVLLENLTITSTTVVYREANHKVF